MAIVDTKSEYSYLLCSHFQQGLEKELADVTEKFEEKKRKFLESSEEFRKKLKEVVLFDLIRTNVM